MFGFMLSSLTAQNTPLQNFESAYLAQNRYPNRLNSVDWFPDDLEVQGVTNDGVNWFFTIVNQGSSMFSTEVTEGMLWKIPKGVDLQGNVKNKPGVLQVKATDISELKNAGHFHWGDPDRATYKGVDYILVPIYGIVACFRAGDLKYLNYAAFDGNVSGGWCAVGKDNALYSSANNPTSVVRYEVDWEKLVNTKQHDALSNPQSIALKQANGSPLYMTDMQGGEFTPSGEMLYLVSGRGECLGSGAPWSPRDGIHAIRTDTWTQVEQSVKNSEAKNFFSYDYDPTCLSFFDCPTGSGTHTPEGLTFWDLEDGGAPGIRGSLHVLVDRYTVGGSGCDDELIFHHFSTKVFVAQNAGNGPGLLGRRDNPFKTFNEAINYYPIWNGARLVLKPGDYPTGGITLNKRMLITSEGGAAVIR
jgi:hypothetical protein